MPDPYYGDDAEFEALPGSGGGRLPGLVAPWPAGLLDRLTPPIGPAGPEPSGEGDERLLLVGAHALVDVAQRRPP